MDHTGSGMLPGHIHKKLYSDRRKRFNGDMRIPKELELKSFGGHRKGWATTNPKDDVTYYDHEAATSAVEFLQAYEGDAPFYHTRKAYDHLHVPHATPCAWQGR